MILVWSICRQLEDRQKEVNEALQQMGFNQEGGKGSLSFRFLFKCQCVGGKLCNPPTDFLKRFMDFGGYHSGLFTDSAVLQGCVYCTT